MYIIKNGKARVSKLYMGQRVTLAVLGKGEVFGELSFFDALPRSASVEALTDLEVIVIDGKKAGDQIANLPPWVVPIFKTVFHRFREADQKITILQSMNEFQKKVTRTDGVAKSIYLELLRLIRTIELLYSRELKISGKVKRDTLYQEMDDVLGQRIIGLAAFWKVLKENDFIDLQLEEKQGEVLLNLDSLNNWRTYLSRQIESDRFLLLSFSAVAVLRKIVNTLFATPSVDAMTEDKVLWASIESLGLTGMALSQEGLEELRKQKIIELDSVNVTCRPSDILENFNYQNLMKSFDHTMVNLE